MFGETDSGGNRNRVYQEFSKKATGRFRRHFCTILKQASREVAKNGLS